MVAVAGAAAGVAACPAAGVPPAAGAPLAAAAGAAPPAAGAIPANCCKRALPPIAAISLSLPLSNAALASSAVSAAFDVAPPGLAGLTGAVGIACVAPCVVPNAG